MTVSGNGTIKGDRQVREAPKQATCPNGAATDNCTHIGAFTLNAHKQTQVCMHMHVHVFTYLQLLETGSCEHFGAFIANDERGRPAGRDGDAETQ